MWVLISLAAALVLKVYTSRAIVELQGRLYQARQALREAKKEKHTVTQRQARAADELEMASQRVQSMKQLIDDLNLRLEGGDMKEVVIAEDVNPAE